MNMEIEYFKELFCSLTQISPLTFAVWNDDGLLFSSRRDVTDISIHKQIEDFSINVMREGVFRHASINGQKAVFGVPIRNDEQTIGSLLAYSKDSNKKLIPNEIASTKIPDVNEIKTLLTRLVLIIEDKWKSIQEREQITEELSRSFEDLHLYSQVASQIKTLINSNYLHHNDLVLNILKTMRVDISFVNFFEHEESKIAFNNDNLPIDANNIVESLVKSLVSALSTDNTRQKKNYFIVEDSRTCKIFDKLHFAQFRFLAVKIMHGNKFYGWMGLVSFNLKESFRRSELRLLISMAEQLAMLITNTNLYKQLEEFVVNIIKTMVSAVEAKDKYTKGHSERVSQMCIYMAEYLKMEEVDKKNLEWAAILHDVGKIGVPESILCKEGPLDDYEYGVIKEHPKKGSEILKHISQLSDVISSILHHHERYDGKGYPDGLKGEDIPLNARIIAIVDTYDALTSKRSYRSEATAEKALSIIDEVAGTQLDPNLVSVFKKVHKEMKVLEKAEQHSMKEISRW